MDEFNTCVQCGEEIQGRVYEDPTKGDLCKPCAYESYYIGEEETTNA